MTDLDNLNYQADLMSGDIVVAHINSHFVTPVQPNLVPLCFRQGGDIVTWLTHRAIDAHRTHSRLLKKVLRLNDRDDVNTVLLYVADGSVEMDNVMDEIADEIDTAIVNLTEVADSDELAGKDTDDQGTYGDSKFSYTGSVAVYNDVYDAGHGMSISLVAVEIVRHIA